MFLHILRGSSIDCLINCSFASAFVNFIIGHVVPIEAANYGRNYCSSTCAAGGGRDQRKLTISQAVMIANVV
jgi:hypothetical protein